MQNSISLYADDILLYLDNVTHDLLYSKEMFSLLSSFSGHRVNLNKSGLILE